MVGEKDSNENTNYTTAVVYNLCISNLEKQEFSSEFEDLIKEIIETNDENFLSGIINPMEFLITKYTDIPKEEISFIKTLKLNINENFTHLNEFGNFLNNLELLNLEHSRIRSIETIGSSFVNLRNLNVSNCNLVDLTGKILNNSKESFVLEV